MRAWLQTRLQQLPQSIGIATGMMLLITTFLPLYVLKGDTRAVNLFVVMQHVPIAYIIFPLLTVVFGLIGLKKRWSLLASSLTAAVTVVVFFATSAQTDQNAPIPDWPFAFAMVIYLLLVPIFLGIGIYKFFRPTKKIKISKAPQKKQKLVYFTVSQSKLVIMSLCTLGLYEIYWFYRNWDAIKKSEGSDINALLYGVFRVITVFALFKRIKGISKWVAPGYVALIIAGYLQGVFFFVGMLTFWPLLYAQKSIKQNEEYEESVDFSTREIVFACLGGLFVAATILGTV